jgi:hypothetical protein
LISGRWQEEEAEEAKEEARRREAVTLNTKVGRDAPCPPRQREEIQKMLSGDGGGVNGIMKGTLKKG